MNLFCFTLDGSSESIYEPPYSPALKDIQSKYQCSPLPLRNRLEWGGSEPSIHFKEPPQNGSKAKRNNRRLCLSTKPLNSETSDKHINQACWVLPCDRRDLLQRSNYHQVKGQNRETCKTAKASGRLNSDSRHTPAQPSQGADATQSMCITRKLKNLKMQTKGGLQGGAAERMETHNDPQPIKLCESSPLFTCVRRGTKTEEPFKSVSSPHQQRQAKDATEDSEDIWKPQLGHYRWGPFECSQPWTPFYHACPQPAHHSWVCGRSSTLSGATEWDRFEVLIQELEGKQSDPIPTPAPTDLPPGPTSPTRHGRYDAFGRHSPSTGPQDDGVSSQKKTEGHSSVQTREESWASGSPDPVKAFSPTMLASITHRKTPTGEPEKGEAADGRRRLSVNSLESLYSLTSRQSSSSGVTSTSDYFSNRDSLRLDDDMFAKQYCGRARVHTDFVPSPYDTESLSLKVGDVIDIIAKPTMGIWTGKLRDKIGNFKFIYVDVLSEECPDSYPEPYSVRQKSTVREVLKRLSLEEYSSSLQLHGYQTVDDLMRLRERHLMELNVTDPEHRHRLLAAVRSLQQLHSCDESEANQEAAAPSKSSGGSARDSGCHMPPDSSPEDGDLDLISQCFSPADVTVT